MRKAVKVIAILSTLGCIGYFFLLCIYLKDKATTWISFLSTVFAMIIMLILLWALHGALARIEDLERDVYKLNDKQRKVDLKNDVVENSKLYRHCKACGAIVRTDEDKCPKCNLPYDE